MPLPAEPQDTPTDRAESKRWIRLTAVALALWAASVGLIANLSNGLTAKSDTYWYWMLGHEMFQPAVTDKLQDQVIAAMRAAPQPPDLLPDFAYRREVHTNYALIAAVSHAVDRLLRPGAEARNYPRRLARAILASEVLSYLLVLIPVLVIVAVALEPLAASAFALSVAILALLSIVPAPDPSGNLLFLGGIERIANIGVLALVPGEAFTAVSFWPRCLVGLIAMVAVALRWQGREGAAYPILLAALLVHHSLATVIIALFALTDFTLRPRSLLKPAVAVALALWVVGLFALGDLAKSFDAASLAIGAGLLAGAVALAFLARRLWFRFLTGRTGGRAARAMHWLMGRGRIESDLALWIAGWLVTLPITLTLAVALGDGTAPGGNQAWANIHSRLLGVLQPLVVLGLCMLALRWLRERMIAAGRPAAAAGLGAASVVAFIATLGTVGTLWQRGLPLGAETAALDRALTEPRPAGAHPSSHDARHALIMYAMTRTLDTGTDALGPLLASRPELMAPLSRWSWPKSGLRGPGR